MNKDVFNGGGFQGVQPPPQFSDFFLKSEGKEVERKRKRNKMGRGLIVNIFFGLRFYEWGCDIFKGLRNIFGGVRNFRGGGGEKFFFWGGGFEKFSLGGL